MSLPSDEWGTPAWLTDFIRARWGAPDLDVAASEEFHVAPRYFTRGTDALARDWVCDMAFCNPPYSSKSQNYERNYLADFTERGRRAVLSGEARRGVVFVVPFAPSTRWWWASLVVRGARHERTCEVAIGDRRAWLLEWRDPDGLRVEVVCGFGRVAFLQSGRRKGKTGRGEVAIVALLRETETSQTPNERHPSRLPPSYYHRNGVTLYHGDARKLAPLLSAGRPSQECVVVTDPVWPNAPKGMFPVENPAALFAEVARHLPALARRAVVKLGCNSDPRYLGGIPEEMPFVRAVWLRYAWPSAKGTILYSGDVAYVFGSSEPGDPPTHERHYNARGLLPGECTSRGRGRRGPYGYAPAAGHPCPRDPEHVRWLVSKFTRAGDIVVDPFAGSGTTLRAAWELGRPAVGVEADERWCEQAALELDAAMAQGRLFA